MGMGYGANFAYVVEEESIKKVCSEEMKILYDLFDKYEESLVRLGLLVAQDYELDAITEDEEKDLRNALQQVITSFKEKTGLNLFLHYHDSNDEGDRYDDVDGAFFCIPFNNVVALTPEAQKAKEEGIEFGIKYWVTYG